MANCVPGLINDLEELRLGLEGVVDGIRLQRQEVKQRCTRASKVFIKFSDFTAEGVVFQRVLRALTEWTVVDDSIIVSGVTEPHPSICGPPINECAKIVEMDSGRSSFETAKPD